MRSQQAFALSAFVLLAAGCVSETEWADSSEEAIGTTEEELSKPPAGPITLESLDEAPFTLRKTADHTLNVAMLAEAAPRVRLITRRLSDVKLDRRLTEASSNLSGLSLRSAFKFDSSLQASGHRRPQAISPHYGADGKVQMIDGHYWLAVTVPDVWYDGVNGAQSNHQLSVIFVDRDTGAYRRVVLVNTLPSTTVPGGIDIAPVLRHGDGVVWYKSYLICQNGASMQVFDTNKIFELRDGSGAKTGYSASTGTFDADNESYVMPMVSEYDGAAVPSMASASLDQKDGLNPTVGFYAATKNTGIIVRWPLDEKGSSAFLEDAARNIPAERAYRLGGWNPKETLRGLARAQLGDHTYFYFGKMRTLHRIKWKVAAQSEGLGSLPVGNEQLAWDPDRNVIWGNNEQVGNKLVFELRPE